MENSAINFDLQRVIFSLIKDDLLNFKLVQGLRDIGLDASVFQVKIHESIFVLMGFNEEDLAHGTRDWYCTLTEKVSKVDLTKTDELDGFAIILLTGLQARKQEIKPKNP